MFNTYNLPLLSSEELCFGVDGNLRLHSSDGGTARNYKISCYFGKIIVTLQKN